MANHKAKGTAVEHKVRKRLLAEGWVVYRGAASLGSADLIALRGGEPETYASGRETFSEVLLIQVKANKSGGPYANFRKAERSSLSAEAAKAGAEAVLVHWPPNGEEAWYHEPSWP